MKKFRIFVLFSFIWLQIFSALPVLGQTDHIIITEVQLAGQTSKDEFIEIYNPTAAEINLMGWRLTKKTASGAEYNLITQFPDIIVPPSNYLLISHPTDYVGSIQADLVYSTTQSIASDNTIILYSDAGETVVDMVGFGNAAVFETLAAPNPIDNQSLERRKDEMNNYVDENNNFEDFFIQEIPNPQNSTSPADGEGSSNPEGDEPEDPAVPETPPLPDNNFQFGSIVINEFVFDPAENEKEWLEIFSNLDQETNLEGWKIEDGTGVILDLAGIINKNENQFLTFELSSSKLNNSGDVIKLFDPQNNLIDQIVYGDWDDGNTADNIPLSNTEQKISLARRIDGQFLENSSDAWQETTTITKGAANIITQPENNSNNNSSNTGSPPVRRNENNNPSNNENELPIDPSLYKKIIINEFLPNPAGPDEENEFIELKNIGLTEVDLAGVILQDNSSKKYIIKKTDFLSTIIGAGKFFVIERKISGIALNNTKGDTVKIYTPDEQLLEQINYSGKAPEDQSFARGPDNNFYWTIQVTKGLENVIIKPNEPPKAVINVDEKITVGQEAVFDASDSFDPDNDEITYFWQLIDSTNEAIKEGKEIVFKEIFLTPGTYQIVLTVTDSRGKSDQIKKKFVVVGDLVNTSNTTNDYPKILINEFLPNPAGSDKDEWIELYNPNEFDVDLSSWKIDDEEGGSRPFTIGKETTIASKQYLVFSREKTGLALNNSADSVRLLGPDNEVIDQVDYESPFEASSYCLDQENDWVWSSTLTPGVENTILEVSKVKELKTSAANKTIMKSSSKTKPIIKTSLEKVRENDLGDSVQVEGIVSVEPGILGVQVFYLAGSGIQIYMYKKDFPELKLGTQVRVTGVLSQSQNEMRINVKEKGDILILGQKDLPAPYVLETGETINVLEGWLVTVNGELLESKGRTLYLDNGSEEIEIYLKSSTGIEKPNFLPGDQISVTGIISQNQKGYRLLPRYNDDLKKIIVSSEIEGKEQAILGNNSYRNKVLLYLFGSIGGLIIILVILKLRVFGSRP